MSQKLDSSPAVIGIDIGKNSFHLVGQDRRGAIVLRQKWSRGQAGLRIRARTGHSTHFTLSRVARHRSLQAIRVGP
jgi:hypothetical protein